MKGIAAGCIEPLQASKIESFKDRIETLEAMPSLALHIVLLFAVAYSQILGGVSCCCLSHVIATGLMSATVTKSAEIGTARQLPSKSKCPKCAASRSATARASSSGDAAESGRDQRCSAAENSECKCLKTAFNAASETETRAAPTETRFIATPVLARGPSTKLEGSLYQEDEVPIRYGGKSWQSIACVWKK